MNRKFVHRAVRDQLLLLSISHPVLVTTVPNACDVMGYCAVKRVVYYCVDDFAEWPGLEKHLVKEMEEALIRKSDIFMATSHILYEKLCRYGKPAHLLTH